MLLVFKIFTILCHFIYLNYVWQLLNQSIRNNNVFWPITRHTSNSYISIRMWDSFWCDKEMWYLNYVWQLLNQPFSLHLILKLINNLRGNYMFTTFMVPLFIFTTIKETFLKIPSWLSGKKQNHYLNKKI